MKAEELKKLIEEDDFKRLMKMFNTIEQQSEEIKNFYYRLLVLAPVLFNSVVNLVENRPDFIGYKKDRKKSEKFLQEFEFLGFLIDFLSLARENKEKQLEILSDFFKA